MADRRNIVRAIDDVVERSPGFGDFKNNALVAMLEDGLHGEESVRYALAGDDHKQRKSIFFLTDRRLINAYRKNERAWAAEDVLLKEMADASLKTGSMYVKIGVILLKDGEQLEVRTLDGVGIQRLFSLIRRSLSG